MEEKEKLGKGMYKFVQKDQVEYQQFSPISKEQGKREELEWIKRQIEYSSFSEKYLTRYSLKRGEIYEFDWGININAEFSNRHYGVVLCDSNEFNPLVIVCPLKTNHTGAHPESDVDLGYVDDLSYEKKTIAVINQIRSLDKIRIYTRRIINSSKTKIGFAESLNEENIILRLSDEKLSLIMNAYKNMLKLSDN